MTYLIWQIEARATLKEQIERAAEAFLLRTGTPATVVVIHAADRPRMDEVTGIRQLITDSSARTGMVNPGMFWVGTPG